MKISKLDAKEVIKVNKQGKVLLGGEVLDQSSIENLKAEVLTLKEMRIWRVFTETLSQYAIDKGFNDALNWEECLAGKMMAHNIGVLKNLVGIIEKL